MRPARCHRLFCRKHAAVAVGRHLWCARHGLEQLTIQKREVVNARG